MVKQSQEMYYERKDFYAGIGNNPHKIARGQFISSQNVNVTGQVPLVRTAQKSGSTRSTGGYEMYCYIQPSYNNLYGLGEDGKIYRLSSNPSVLVGTLSSGGDIVGACIYNDYIRWVESLSSPKIGRMPVSGHSSSRSSSWTQDYVTDPDWTNNRVEPTSFGVSFLFFNGSLYFSNEKRVFEIDMLGTCTLVIDTLPARVVGMSAYGQRIKIYLEDGQVLFYDGIDSRDEKVDIGMGVLAVKPTANGDYIIGGQESTNRNAEVFGVFQGYQFTQLTTQQHTGAYFDLYGRCAVCQIAENNGTVYIAGDVYADGIYTFGRSMPGLPYALNYEFHTAGSNYAYEQVHSMYVYSRNLVVSYTDTNGTTQVDIISIEPTNTTRQASGHIVLDNFDAGSRGMSKRLKRIEICGSFDASNTIEVQYRKNISALHRGSRRYIIENNPSWTSLFTLSSGDPFEYRDGVDVDVMFYDIQFRIVLSGNTVSLSGLKIYFDEIRDV